MVTYFKLSFLVFISIQHIYKNRYLSLYFFNKIFLTQIISLFKMSFHPPYFQPSYQYNSILAELEKAFKQINHICVQFLKSSQNSFIKQNSLIQNQLQRHINFNNYKTNIQPKNNQPQNRFNDIEVDQAEFQRQNKNQISNFNNSQQSINNLKPNKKKINIKNNKNQNDLKINPESKTIPNPPKAPLSPYFTFYRQKKDIIRNQFPQMSITQITSAAAKVWKSLTDEQKGPYTRRYYEQKRQYHIQMAQYVKKYPNYKEIIKKPNGKK